VVRLDRRARASAPSLKQHASLPPRLLSDPQQVVADRVDRQYVDRAVIRGDQDSRSAGSLSAPAPGHRDIGQADVVADAAAMRPSLELVPPPSYAMVPLPRLDSGLWRVEHEATFNQFIEISPNSLDGFRSLWYFMKYS
jgi:hypothetical protein